MSRETYASRKTPESTTVTMVSSRTMSIRGMAGLGLSGMRVSDWDWDAGGSQSVGWHTPDKETHIHKDPRTIVLRRLEVGADGLGLRDARRLDHDVVVGRGAAHLLVDIGEVGGGSVLALPQQTRRGTNSLSLFFAIFCYLRERQQLVERVEELVPHRAARAPVLQLHRVVQLPHGGDPIG